MKALQTVLVTLTFWFGLVGCIIAQKSGPLVADDYEGYAKYFAGTYSVVGRLPVSRKAYSGEIVLTAKDKEFKVTRTVAGKTTEGRGFVDVDPTGRHIFVMEFTQASRRYEGTYMFMNNFDNYPRLAGRVGKPGHSREWSADDGLEALFPADDPACADGT